MGRLRDRVRVSSPQDLLPPDVVVVEASAQMWGAPLTEAESAFVKNAVPSRRSEFQAGRAAARCALRRYGILGWDLLPDTRRRPVWPAGIVGSITHCKRYCLVAIARRDRYLSIGIDAEEATALPSELMDMVCTAGEQEWLRSVGASGGLCAKLIFSAKEAFYKAYSPVVDEFLDFLDVEISFDFSNGSFIAECHGGPVGPAGVFRRRVGRFTVKDDLVITAVAVEAVA